MTIVLKMPRGRRFYSVAAFVILSLSATPALAQRALPELPAAGGAGTGGAAGIAGGAGLGPAVPELRPTLVVPAAPPIALPATVAPVTPVPAAAAKPAAVVKSPCELDPGSPACQEPAVTDGGGDDTCDCAQGCTDDADGRTVCRKQ